MSKPNQNRAGMYLQSWLRHQPISVMADKEKAEEERGSFLARFFALADLDYADCDTDDERRKVWSAVTAALLETLNSYQIDSVALRSLHDNLVNSALRRPAEVSMGANIIGGTKPISEEWRRACVVALWERYPDARQQIATDCSRFTDVRREAVPKLVENYKGGLIGGRVFSDLVETARNRISETGAKRLKGLM